MNMFILWLQYVLDTPEHSSLFMHVGHVQNMVYVIIYPHKWDIDI